MDERKNIFPCTLNLPFYILNFTFAPLRRAGAGSSGRVANAARGVPALCGRVANAARGVWTAEAAGGPYFHINFRKNRILFQINGL